MDEYTIIKSPENATSVSSDLITWEAPKPKNNPLLGPLRSEITIHNTTLTSL